MRFNRNLKARVLLDVQNTRHRIGTNIWTTQPHIHKRSTYELNQLHWHYLRSVHTISTYKGIAQYSERAAGVPRAPRRAQHRRRRLAGEGEETAQGEGTEAEGETT